MVSLTKHPEHVGASDAGTARCKAILISKGVMEKAMMDPDRCILSCCVMALILWLRLEANIVIS